MIRYARIVLQDCKHAITKHSINLQAEEFRISWITIITLLRSVGHVLQNKDSQISRLHKKAIDKKWNDLNKTKPVPEIFWEFIVKERNRFLKEYEHGISRVGHIGVRNTDGKGEISLSLDMANSRGSTMGVDNTQIKSVISSGKYKDQNEKEVAWMAHDWWNNYLYEIDSLISSYTKNNITT